jgi:hypothetical protein
MVETDFGRLLIDRQPATIRQEPGPLYAWLYARHAGENMMIQLDHDRLVIPHSARSTSLSALVIGRRKLPQAPVGHHWQDSTNIAAKVATVVLKHQVGAARSQRLS